MLIRTLAYISVVLVILHGLIHLMGFIAYWPQAELAGLPYRTTLLGQRWLIGPSGMRLYSVLWLLVAGGLTVAAIALLLGRPWWLPLLMAAVLVSLVITLLDWSNAFRGTVISLLILVPLLLILGLRVRPQPFPNIPQQSQALHSFPLPADLPAPVSRYYETTIGDQVPFLESAVITGRGRLRFAGITFPARLRFTHDAGQGYRHYIEATLYGFPLMKVNERYLDGRGRMELPVGTVENEPKVNMAANLGLWGESIWLPSIYLTDPRVRWEAIDETSARLIVPFETGEDSFIVVFNRGTGLLESMEAMRYREATDTKKIPWRLEILDWQEFQGILIPSVATVTWADEGTPWLVIEVEDVVYNTDIGDYIRSRGY